MCYACAFAVLPPLGAGRRILPALSGGFGNGLRKDAGKIDGFSGKFFIRRKGGKAGPEANGLCRKIEDDSFFFNTEQFVIHGSLSARPHSVFTKSLR
jgi:hypothetical protein